MAPWLKIVLIVLCVGVVAAVGLLLLRRLVAAISPRPSGLGVTDGRLAPCMSYPNGVCSQAEDEVHAIAPLVYTGDTGAAHERLLVVLKDLPRITVVVDEPTYLYVEQRTAGMRYIDDIEFLFDPDAHLIHVRSSARVPYYDFQVNRKRMEAIRAAFGGAY